jgi:hypothetical protein
MSNYEDYMPGGRGAARWSDPETSWQAAKRLGDLTEQQAKVWQVLILNGAMIDELLIVKCREAGIGMSDSGIRSRRNELVNAGLVVDTGKTGRTVRGRNSTKWRAMSLDEYRARQESEAEQPSLFGSSQ